MVDVIKKKCKVTGNVITGLGLNDFKKNWDEHIESLSPKKEEKPKATTKSKPKATTKSKPKATKKKK